MSQILYYSNYCDNCKKLLQTLSKSQIKKEIHFLSIDKRVQKNNGATYIILENNQEIILPPTITRVPALLLLTKGHHVLFGEEIYNHLKPVENNYNQEAVKTDSEPTAFVLNSSMNNVTSDNYSFLDQNADDLSAKGSGGMRQLYNYATISQNDNISTPPEDYSPDTIGEVSLEQLQQARQSDIKK